MERSKPAAPKVQLMLDSGAFSAWKRGIDIDLDDYIDYIKKHEKLLYSYVSLDVIPGAPGRRASQGEVEKAAQQSYKNHQRMKKAELSPIPVFHFGESFDWLTRFLDDDEPYIGLGGMGNPSVGEQMQWLDRCFTMLTDDRGEPIVKTHGFGVASFDLLRRYPWFTADATSWALTAAYGSIYVPIYRNGKPSYGETPVKLTVSEVDRKEKNFPPDHYLRFGPMMKERVIHFLTKEVGVKVEDAAKDYEVRARAIVFFLLRFQDAIGDQPFRHRTGGFG